MATLTAPEAQTRKTIKGRTYKLAGTVTLAEYYTSIMGAFDSQSVCTKTNQGEGSATVYNVWEPAW